MIPVGREMETGEKNQRSKRKHQEHIAYWSVCSFADDSHLLLTFHHRPTTTKVKWLQDLHWKVDNADRTFKIRSNLSPQEAGTAEQQGCGPDRPQKNQVGTWPGTLAMTLLAALP
ncbi:INO80 complex subunit E [Platysternon megacephalum]|uniref:INO80 complex subunit E n=1 Tax=Platysternon megacephalum TaxID=55544 RepID=A0A4D9DT33_9SAUR|nr:INO80 complex subunit E [Platysternon megacephalum]